jgi:hypothetical protein
MSLSEQKDGNLLLKPPLFLGRPISNIFSQGEPHQSENMDSSPLLSHNIDQSVGRGFEKIVTKLIECDVEIETVQVIR